MCRPTIRGSYTAGRLWHGRAGIRIRGFGTAGRTCHLALDTRSGGTEGTGGAGTIGEPIGITTTSCTTTTRITRAAGRSTTAMLIIGTAETAASKRMCIAEETSRTMVITVTIAKGTSDVVANRTTVARARRTGVQVSERPATFTIIPAARRTTRSKETPRRREDMPSRTVQAELIAGRSATTITAERAEDIRRTVAAALAEEAPAVDMAAADLAAAG